MIIKWAVSPSTFFVQTVCVSEALELFIPLSAKFSVIILLENVNLA